MAKNRSTRVPSLARVRDYAAENARREARARAAGTTAAGLRRQRGIAKGLSGPQARGHPSQREVGARDYAKLVKDIRGASYVSTEVRDPTGAPEDRKLVIRIVDSNGKITTHVYDVRVKDRLLAQLKKGKVPPPSPGSYGLDVPKRRLGKRTRPPKGSTKRKRK